VIPPPLLLVAATRLEEDTFWSDSLLGRSLVRPAHASYGRCLGYANRRALAHTYNHGLEQADDEALVVFCHDDLWLGEQSLVPPLTEALERFDLVGVAGNRRCEYGQQWWLHRADGSGWDHPHLVGALLHGSPEAAQLQTYGPSPAPAVLLDGVFLAGRAGVLRCAGLRFDPDVPFHLYDLDLCRSAEQAGLRLGVWPLDLIHASGGEAFTPAWKACLVLYRRKWEPPTPAPAGPEALRWQYAQARAHQQLEQWPQALAAYDALLAIEPRHGRALQQRALVLHQLDRPNEALASLDAALALDPANATALANRASLLQAMGADSAGVEAALRAALAQRPDDTDLLHRLAAFLSRRHRPIEAIEVLRQLLRHDRQHSQALFDLGGLLLEAGGFALARSAFQRVLSEQPSHGQALFGLGQCHEASGDADAALAAYTRGLEQAPDDLNLLTMAESMRLGLCLWDDYEGRMERLAERLQHGLDAGDSVPVARPMRLLSFPLPLELPAQVAARHAAAIATATAPLVPAQPAAPRPPSGSGEGRPLRIGYLSADFRCHAMGGLIHGLFAQHDRRRCVPIGYMLAAGRDRFTRSVARGCERLRDGSQLGSEALAELIRDDGIDVLVDLMGYTHQGRPSLLALRPAPLQLLYLGYPGSMGAPLIDGLVADAWLIPPELEHGYSERVHRLPHGFVCSAPLPADPEEALPPSPSRAALGLEPDQLVYACFNRPDKFDPQRFAAWMAVLKAVPASVLLLVVPHPASQRRLRERAQACGVEPGRLIFAARTPAAQFTDLCQVADLFLDTAHYGAGATGAMALQAGLPLLTCPAESFVSRMGASLCASVGMHDLICPDSEAYVARAIELGRDHEQLRQRRQRLLDPDANLPLFDTAGWVRHWEELLHGLLLRQA
jgi:protein O-GlcNAc transferase